MRSFSSLIVAAALSLSTFAACATSGDEYSETEDEAAGTGKFTLTQAANGSWHFNLKSGNGAILLTSEQYTTRTGAINGILSVQTNGVDAAMYKVVPAAKGFVLHLVAANNEIISFSQTYSTKSSATRAITSCVKATTSYLDKREAMTTGARVDVAVGDTGKFHFNFHAKNGQIVLSSESYTTEAAAFNGAYAVQVEGQNAAAYTLKQSASGSFYFTVKASNHEIIGVSQQYTTKAGAEAGMEALRALLPSITVI
jgi:uncharacterized protein YegP (UPF0339 family)